MAEPPCTLCHKTLDGGANTAVKSFGRDAVTLYGLTGGSDTKLLVSALNAMKRDGTDSDGDGQSNYDELVAGTDPNDKKSFIASVVEVPVGGSGGAPATDPLGDGGELSSCTPARLVFPTPEYGCSFQRGGAQSGAGSLIAASLIAFGLVSRRRRNQRGADVRA